MKEKRQEIIDYLVYESEGDWSEKELIAMSDYELFDAYLKWIGIIGYTKDIVEKVEDIWDVKLKR